MANASLHAAKDAKNDEFYTRIEDINEEMNHYEDKFKGKTVFCNCDDPTWSNFWKYFHMNFEYLGLKRLIATHYEPGEVQTYKIEYAGGNDLDFEDGVITPLEQNGDFRSDECLALLEESDIVATNPPFSLFREFVTLLIKYEKEFIIIGPKNAITYKEIFPLIKDNRLWLGNGFKAGNAYFVVPEGVDTTQYARGVYDPSTNMVKFRNCTWFTNVDHAKRHERLETIYRYEKRDELYPDLYPKYDNYDAINVDRVNEIPLDYCESWAVTENEYGRISEDWDSVRSEKKDGVTMHYVIPKNGTALREVLLQRVEGYKEKIETSLMAELSGAGSVLDAKPVSQRYCNGIIGVPITFLDKYNPEQFRIIGHEHDINGNGGVGIEHGQFESSGRGFYKRILIRQQ